MESTTIVTQTESGIRLRRSSEDENSAEARRQRRRERSRSREERENVKFQKVEYQVVLKAEGDPSLSSADTSSDNADRPTTANGQEENEADNIKLASGKEDEFDEDDIRKAGEEMKAKFEEGRKVFEKAPEGGATNLKTEDTAAKRKRDLGRKRAQFLFRGASDVPTPTPRQQPQSGKSTTSDKISDAKNSDSSSQLEPKKQEVVAAPSRQSFKQPEAQREEQQPPQPPHSLHAAKDDTDGRHFPEEDEEAKRRRKNREERNKRRREGEGVRLRRQSDPKDSATETKPRSSAGGNFKSLSQSELPTEQVAIPDSSAAEKTQVDEATVKPEEQEKQEKQEKEVSMNFDFPQREIEEIRIFSQTKQEKSAEEEKSFHSPPDGSSEEKADGISPVNSDEVDSTLLVSLDSQDKQKPALEVIETAVPTQRGTRAENETIGDERKRKKKEMEEKRRRIEERQRKAAEEKRRQERGETVPETTDKAKLQEETVDDRQERRRSLLLMWESMSDPVFSSPRTPDSEEEPMEIFKRDIKPIRKDNSLKREKKVHNLEEDSQPSTEQLAMEAKTDSKQQLADGTRRWNKTDTVPLNGNLVRGNGQRQKEDKNAASQVQNDFSSQQEEERKSFLGFRPKELLQEPSYEQAREENEVESAPEPLWRSEDGYGMGSDDDKQQRRPFYEQDEHHHMTEDEIKWESAGQFQPGKLDTSKFNKFAKTGSGDSGKSSLKKNDASRYDWLKKMHNTQSKQEILVPTKLKVNSQGEEVLEENGAGSEPDRPYVVEKLDEALTVQFQRGESHMVDNQKSRFENERRKQEQDEMERARLEEENRSKREKKEPEEENEKEEFYPDEVDKRVKMGSVGGKVDVTMWQRLCDEKAMKHPENVQKRKERNVSMLSVEHSPGAAPELQDDAQLKKRKPHPGSKGTVKEETKQPIILEREAKEEDELERRIKQKSIHKLDRKRLNLQETPEDERRKKLTEERIKQELEEMELLKQEELRRRELEENEQVEKSEGSDEDDYDRRIRKQNVGKLPLENNVFRVAEMQKDICASPQKHPQQKAVVQKKESIEEKVQIEKAPEPVEVMPIDLNPEEDDEYEVKIKQKCIHKLDINLFPLQQTPDDEQRKLREEERIKRELEEMELLRQEELRRCKVAENELEEKSEDSDEDEYDRRIRKQNVGKLPLENNVFRVAEIQKDICVSPQKQPTQKAVVQKKESIEEKVQIEKAPEPVEVMPIDLKPEEEDEYEVKIKQKSIHKLDINRFTLQQTPDDEQRKLREEERIKRELEEMELLKQEELRRCKVTENEQEEKSEDSDEDEYDRRIRKQNVGKLPLVNNVFRVAEMQKDICASPQKQPTQNAVVQKQQSIEEKVQTEKAPEPVEVMPIDLKPEEEDEYEVKIKQKSIHKLDINRFTLQQTSDDEQRKLREEERTKRELEEMELLKQEELRRRELEENEQDEKSEDSDEDEYDRRIRKQNVGKLQLKNVFPVAEMQKDICVSPQKQPKQKAAVQKQQSVEEKVEIEKASEPVEMIPIDLKPEEEDEFEIKIKQRAIGKLDINRFHLQQSSDDERMKKQKELKREAIVDAKEVQQVEDSDETDHRLKERKVGRLPVEKNPLAAAELRVLEKPKTHDFKEVSSTGQPGAQRWLQEQAELEKVREEERRRSENNGEIDELETCQDENMDKPKSVGKLNQDRMNPFKRRHEVGTERTRQVLVEKESDKKSTSNLYEIENKVRTETNFVVCSNKENNEENRRVGKLNVKWMDVVKDETKKGINAHSNPALQQESEEPSQNDFVSAKQVEVAESTPPMAVDSEDAVYEQKRKSEGVKPLDFNKFIQNTNQDMEERKKRKQELEQERQRFERQEMEQQRQEQLLRKKHEQEAPLRSNESLDTNEKFVIEPNDSSKHPEGKVYVAAEEDHSGKKLGRVHLGNVNGFPEEGKDVEENRKQGKVDLGMWADIDRNAKGKKQKNPNTDSAAAIETTLALENAYPESAETRGSQNEDEKESERETPAKETPEDKPRCGKLDPSRFATFQMEQQRGTSALRRSKSETDTFETRTLDDSGVQKRITERPLVQKSRPKSIAVMDTKNWETAGQSTPAQKKVVLMGRDDEMSELTTDNSTDGVIESPRRHVRSVKKLDTSAWESRTSKRN